MKIKSVYIENYRSLKDFEIDFTNDNGQINPVTILTGINGCGKTTLLNAIYELYNNNCSEPDNLKSFVEIDISDNTENKKSSKKIFKLTSEYFDNKHSKSNPLILPNIIYYKPNQDNPDAKQIILDFVENLINDKYVNSSDAHDFLRNLLNDLLGGLDLQIEFSRIERNKDVYFRNSINDRIKFKELSDGEKELITKTFPIFLANLRDTVILIDEPESSLHPNWQNEVIRLYRVLAQEQNLQFIISTHSPHIVSAVENKYIKILTKKNDEIVVTNTSALSYGKKVSKILIDIFHVKGLRTPKVEKKLSELKLLFIRRKYNSPEFHVLLKELEETIGKIDTDLVRIRTEVQKAKMLREDKKID